MKAIIKLLFIQSVKMIMSLKKYPEENMFVLSGGKSYVRVSSTDFVSKIGNLINHDFSKKPLNLLLKE